MHRQLRQARTKGNAGELRVAACCQGFAGSAWRAWYGNGGPVGRESAKTTRSRGPPLRVQSASRAAVMTITRTITVAGGVFAPGHLGELTRIVPFGLADGVLEETRTRERRLRVLPSRVGLYFVLAMCLSRNRVPGRVGEADCGAGRAGPGGAVVPGAAGPAPANRYRPGEGAV